MAVALPLSPSGIATSPILPFIHAYAWSPEFATIAPWLLIPTALESPIPFTSQNGPACTGGFVTRISRALRGEFTSPVQTTYRCSPAGTLLNVRLYGGDFTSAIR